MVLNQQYSISFDFLGANLVQLLVLLPFVLRFKTTLFELLLFLLGYWLYWFVSCPKSTVCPSLVQISIISLQFFFGNWSMLFVKEWDLKAINIIFSSKAFCLKAFKKDTRSHSLDRKPDRVYELTKLDVEKASYIFWWDNFFLDLWQ